MNEARSDPPALRIIPPAFLSNPGLRAVLAALPCARIVGGAVRDTLAGQDIPGADIDLATPDDPDRVMAALRAAGLKAVPTGLAHGTVTAVAAGGSFEITTLRRDVRTDGRRAEVAFTDDWRVDASRRDFTINALSMAPDGAVFDYFGGIADLRAGRVRFVGRPATRIAEDYLRIPRFFRFHARYGSGDPDAAALLAIAAAVPGLAQLSVERVWTELKRILAAARPAPSLRLMRDLGVLGAILPEGACPERVARLPDGAPPDPLLRLAALLTGDAAAMADRLRLSHAERTRVLELRAAPPPDPDAASLKRALADTDRDILIGRAWLGGGDPALLAGLATTEAPVFPLLGRDLERAGLPPGPAMGAALRDLRAIWMAGGCTAETADLLAAWHASRPPSTSPPPD